MSSADEECRGHPQVTGSRAPPWRRGVQVVLAGLAVGTGALLVAVDVDRRLFWTGAHAVISATPLFAVAALLVASTPAARLTDRLKGAVGVVAFVAWGLDQLFPGFRYGGDLNDLAILGFVADVLIVVADRAPAASPGQLRGRGRTGGAGTGADVPEEAAG